MRSTCLAISVSAVAIVYLSAVALPTAAENTFVLQRKDGNLVHYKGSVTLTGTLHRYTDQTTIELFGDNICFTPVGDSAKLIPRLTEDSRAPQFCFADFEASIKMLNLPAKSAQGTCGYEAEAKVFVKDYVANLQESEVFDTSTLISVSERGPIRSIKCD